MTAGPYRPIILRTYTTRIAEVHAQAIVSDTQATSLKVDVDLHGTPGDSVKALRVTLSDIQGKQLKTEDVAFVAKNGTALKDVVQWSLDGEVKLWWPVGYGEQTLYKVEVVLLGSVRLLQLSNQTSLIRRLRRTGKP